MWNCQKCPGWQTEVTSWLAALNVTCSSMLTRAIPAMTAWLHKNDALQPPHFVRFMRAFLQIRRHCCKVHDYGAATGLNRNHVSTNFVFKCFIICLNIVLTLAIKLFPARLPWPLACPSTSSFITIVGMWSIRTMTMRTASRESSEWYPATAFPAHRPSNFRSGWSTNTALPHGSLH